jgi:hypothetical protein
MMHGELEGLICSGGMRGKQHTYALLEERVPPAARFSREEALAELTLRFFRSHGPATVREYTAWSGLSVADVRTGLELVKPNLVEDGWEGRTYWFSASMQPVTGAIEAAYLLPEYDECLIAYKDFAYFDLPFTGDKDSWHDTWYRPVLIEGQRAGTWRRTVAKGTVLLETNLFASLNASQLRTLEAAAERYGVFMGMPVTLALPS